MTKNTFKRIKEKINFHQKQKKFQLSIVDWVPHVDWYFLLSYFFILAIVASMFAYSFYDRVEKQIEAEPEGIIVEGEKINFEEVANLMKEYDQKKKTLQKLR